MNKKLINIVYYYVIFQIVELFILCILNTFRVISLVSISYFLYASLAVNIILLILLFITKKRSFKFIDLLLICYIVLYGISTLLAYDKQVAIFGSYERYEGFLSIAYYISLLSLSISIPNKNKKIILYIILITGVLQALMGIIQYIIGFEKIIGFAMNPNFYSTYINLCTWICVYLFLITKKYKLIIPLILLIIALVLSYTLSGILASVICLILLFLITYKDKMFKFTSIVASSFIITIMLLSIINVNNIGSKILTFGKDTIEITKGNGNDKMGTYRIFLWKKTIKYVPKYWIHGIGVDNFYYIDNGSPIYYPTYDKTNTYIVRKVIFDKAHNDYLQILICQGLFSLLIYLTIIGYLMSRTYHNNKLYILIIISYLIQMFFNISVIFVTPIFIIVLGIGNIENDYIE